MKQPCLGKTHRCMIRIYRKSYNMNSHEINLVANQKKEF